MISRMLTKVWFYSLVTAATVTFFFPISNSANATTFQVEVKGEIQQDDAPADQDEQETSANAQTESVSTGLDFLNAGKAPTSIDQLRAMEAHVAQLAEDVKPATVNIRVGRGQGSGVVISSDGYILTAAHVIGQPGQTAIVTFPDGKQVRAETLGTNAGEIDSGILKILDEEGDDWPYVDMGESTTLKSGQWLVAIGHPGGYDDKRGLVLRVGRLIHGDEKKLRTDCTLVGGDSGGPLFDMDGYVVGIHSRIGGKLTDNLHVPVDKFSTEWDQLAAGDVIGGKPGMGFSVTRNSNVVSSVTRNGPASKAGLKVGDVIVKVKDEETSNKAEVLALLKDLEAGDRIAFTVKRNIKKLSRRQEARARSERFKKQKEEESKDSDDEDSDQESDKDSEDSDENEDSKDENSEKGEDSKDKDSESNDDQEEDESGDSEDEDSEDDEDSKDDDEDDGKDKFEMVDLEIVVRLR